MTEQEIKLKCLELAKECLVDRFSIDSLIEKAKALYEFIKKP